VVKKVKKYSVDFKAEVVDVVRRGVKTVPQLVEELGIPESTIYRWIRIAEAKGTSRSSSQAEPSGALNVDEREELKRLRKQVARLEMEKDILKKATAFFARENDPQ
jgi:transposase